MGDIVALAVRGDQWCRVTLVQHVAGNVDDRTRVYAVHIDFSDAMEIASGRWRA